MLPTHAQILFLLKQLNLVPENQPGACHGIAMLWVYYVAKGEEKIFFSVLESIAKGFIEGDEFVNHLLAAANEGEQASNAHYKELYYHLLAIAVGQNPCDFPNLLAEDNVWKHDRNKILNAVDRILTATHSETHSKLFDLPEKTKQLFSDQGESQQKNLVNLFTRIASQVSIGRLSIVFTSIDAAHAAACVYDGDSDSWRLFHSGFLSTGNASFYHSLSSEDIARYLPQTMSNKENIFYSYSFHSLEPDIVKACDIHIKESNFLDYDITTRSSSGRTLFNQSVLFVNDTLLDSLLLRLDQDDRINTIEPIKNVPIKASILDARDPSNLMTLLMMAIDVGMNELALRLIDRDDVDLTIEAIYPVKSRFASVDLPDVYDYSRRKKASTGLTALMIGCFRDNLAVVNALIERNPNCIHQMDIDGNNALHYAIMGGSQDCLQSLIDKLMPSSNYLIAYQNNFLRFMGSSNVRLKQQLQSYNRQLAMSAVYQANLKGESPLHLACKFEEYNMVTQLLRHPAIRVNRMDNDGRTPLQCIQDNEGDATRLLLLGDPRMDINQAMGENSVVPLLWLYAKCSDRFVADMSRGLLIKLLSTRDDIDMTVTDVLGNNVLQSAVKENDAEMVELILQRTDFDINHQNRQGQTVLHIAIYKHQAIIDALFTCNDLEDRSNIDGDTAHALADRVGDDRLCTSIDNYFNTVYSNCAR